MLWLCQYALYCCISQYSEDNNSTIRKVLNANQIAETAEIYSMLLHELEFKMAFALMQRVIVRRTLHGQDIE